MTLRERIENTEFQLTLEHSQPNTVPRLLLALSLLKQAWQHWREPGQQINAIRCEDRADAVMRDLLLPLTGMEPTNGDS